MWCLGQHCLLNRVEMVGLFLSMFIKRPVLPHTSFLVSPCFRYEEAIDRLKGALETEPHVMALVTQTKTKLCHCYSKVGTARLNWFVRVDCITGRSCGIH